MTKVLCDVYRSRNKEELYVYVARQKGLGCLPQELLDLFGRPELALTLVLTPNKKLARVSVEKVLSALEEKGYYVQMPPPKESEMQEINRHNTKLNL